MGVRSIIEDTFYAASNGLGGLGAWWSSAERSTRWALVALIGIAAGAAIIVPQVRARQADRHSLSAEEQRLLEQALGGTRDAQHGELPWWYPPNTVRGAVPDSAP
jgi:hypothetical protein